MAEVLCSLPAAADRYNVPAYAAYAACKGAVEVFSRYVAKEYGSRGIRANTVAPGGIVTDFNNAAIRSNPAGAAVDHCTNAHGTAGRSARHWGSRRPFCAAKMPDGLRANGLRRQAVSTYKDASR